MFGPLRGAALARMRLYEGMDTQFLDRQSLCIRRIGEGVCEYQHNLGDPATRSEPCANWRVAIVMALIYKLTLAWT